MKTFEIWAGRSKAVKRRSDVTADVAWKGRQLTITLHGDTFADPLTNKMKRDIIDGISGRPVWWRRVLALFKRWPLRRKGRQHGTP